MLPIGKIAAIVGTTLGGTALAAVIYRETTVSICTFFEEWKIENTEQVIRTQVTYYLNDDKTYTRNTRISFLKTQEVPLDIYELIRAGEPLIRREFTKIKRKHLM